MPTYEYACLKCGLEFELVQSMKDAPLALCTCGKKGKVRRKIGGGAGIIFKGTGFYETDYKRAGSKKPANSGDSAPSASPAKADTKPAAAAPAKPSSKAAS